MFGLGFVFAAIGAYLIDCAVQNRPPIQTIKAIIQDPANMGTILTETKGTFESSEDLAGGAISGSNSLGYLLNEPSGAGGASTPSSASPAKGKRAHVSKNNSANSWNILKPPPPNSLDLVTVKAGGHSFQVAKSAATQFKDFVNALSAEGYKITSIGGYDSRDIAGTNKPSLHSLGLAIDINPSDNKVAYGKTVTNLPANIESLAKQFGLIWGGSSQFHKRDAMHFSIPTEGYSY